MTRQFVPPAPRRLSRRLSASLAALAVAVPLAACSPDEPERVSTVPVIEPGRPGEPAATHTPGTTFSPVEDEFSAADVTFIAGMVPHHAQALQMAELAPERAQDDMVLGLAARIADVQGAEMDVYRRWLEERGMAEDGSPSGQRAHDGSGHGGSEQDAGPSAHQQMSGMADPQAVEQLRAASGADFDVLWLDLMVAHHEGALEMAEQRALGGGLDWRAEELATDVAVTQLSEIRTMDAIRDRLG